MRESRSIRVMLCACLCVAAIAGPAGAATNYYYVGGVKPVGLGVEGTDYVWTNSGVNAAYDWIMDQDNANNVWEIRVATNYSETLSAGTRVAMDGLKTGGAASAGKVSGIYGARVWDASTSSHSAVGSNYNNKSVLDGANAVGGGLIQITSASGMSAGPTIDGLKLTRGYLGSGSEATSAGVYCTVAKTTLSRLEICDCICAADGRSGIAIKIYAGDSLITDCYIHDNVNSGANWHSQTVVSGGDRNLIRNCRFSGNAARSVAGVYMTGNNGPYHGAIVNCAFTGNTLLESRILEVGRSQGATVVNVLLADNHSAAGYDAVNYFTGLSGNGSDANRGWFVNMTVADNYDATPPIPTNPGVYLYGGDGSASRESYVMNCVFKNNRGITNGAAFQTQGWVVFSLADDTLPMLGLMESNITATAQLDPKYQLANNAPGVNAGGYVRNDTRGGKAFKYLDVNRNGSYTLGRDVIVWHEPGLSIYPPLSGSDFDIIATEALGTWDEYGNYTPGNRRIVGQTIDMGACETVPPRGTVVMVK